MGNNPDALSSSRLNCSGDLKRLLIPPRAVAVMQLTDAGSNHERKQPLSHVIRAIFSGSGNSENHHFFLCSHLSPFLPWREGIEPFSFHAGDHPDPIGRILGCLARVGATPLGASACAFSRAALPWVVLARGLFQPSRLPRRVTLTGLPLHGSGKEWGHLNPEFLSLPDISYGSGRTPWAGLITGTLQNRGEAFCLA